MAPNDPTDPNTIDINLSLLGANDVAALAALTEQLAQVNEHLQQVSQQTYEGQVRAARSRTGRSGVEDQGRPSSRASVGGTQDQGQGPVHPGGGVSDSASTPPIGPYDHPARGTQLPPEFENIPTQYRARAFEAIYGEGSIRAGGSTGESEGEARGNAQRQREQEAAAREVAAQQQRDGWQLRGGGQGVGRDPGDLNLYQQLNNAWRASRGVGEAGIPGYGRTGVMIDSILRARSPEPTGPVAPPPTSGVPSPNASMGVSAASLPSGNGDDPYNLGAVAPGRSPSDPLYNVHPAGINRPITMPQHWGGSWTGQDYLSMASNMFARQYLRRADQGEGYAGQEGTGATQVWRARAANSLGVASQNYAQFHAVWQGGRRLVSRLAGPEGPLGYSIKPGDVERTGEALGYERGQNDIGIDGFGFRTPGDQYLSEAGREGLRSRRLRTDLAAEGLINREQANQMVNVLEGMGWSGQERDTMAYTTMAPLMQQGQNPEVLGPILDRSIRYGSGSLQQFNEAMNHVGQAAQEANMGLDEFQQAMGEFAETAAQGGSTYVQGLQSARRFTGATGMDPRFGAELQQNPIMQSMGMMRYGLLPSQQGLMGGQETAGLAVETTDMMMRMTQGFHRKTRIPIDPDNPNGPKRTIDPLDAHYAQAAAMMDIPVDRFRDLRRRRNQIVSGRRAENALQQFGRDVNQRGARGEIGGQDQSDAFGIDLGLSKDSTDSRNDAARQLEEEGINGGPSWKYVEQQLRGADVDPKEIDRLRHVPIEKRVDAAQAALEKASKKDDRNIHGKHANEVRVKFTGAAEKVFEQVIKNEGGDWKKKVNSGDSNAGGIFGSPVGTGLDIWRTIF
jgi:hypothetical protein